MAEGLNPYSGQSEFPSPEFQDWEEDGKENAKTIENSIKLPETVTLNHFWKAVETGSFEPLADEQVNQIVGKQLDEYSPPLTDLSGEELTAIHKDFAKYLKDCANDSLLKNFAEHELLYLDNTSGRFSKKEIEFITQDDSSMTGKLIIDLSIYGKLWDQKHYMDEEKFRNLIKEYAEFIKKNELGPLTPGQKKAILSDYKIYDSGRMETNIIIGNFERPLERQGTRHIEDYGLGREGGHQKVIERIKEATGRQDITIMDVGGSTGMALHDIKKEFPDCKTINITLNEEPAMFPVDELVICPAEHMAKKFENNVDLVISNISFRYHRYPDISLRNVIKALTVGGEAFIDFGTERSAAREEDQESFSARIEKLFGDLQEMEESGEIETDIDHSTLNVKNISGGGYISLHIVRKK